MARRAFLVVLFLISASTVAMSFGIFDASTCETTAAQPPPPVPWQNESKPAVAFQVVGGDMALIDALRGAVKAGFASSSPSVALSLDGPPARGGTLVRATITSAAVRWTPLWAQATFAVHLQGVGAPREGVARAPREHTVELQTTCRGLVSKPDFEDGYRARLGEAVASAVTGVTAVAAAEPR